MTPALQMLINTRKVRTEQEVEDEFNSRQVFGAVKKEKRQKPEMDADFAGFSDNRKKSHLLLMPSQIEIIKQIF